MKILKSPFRNQGEEKDIVQNTSRRRFFRLTGAIAGAGIFLSAAAKAKQGTLDISGSNGVQPGKGDIALFNLILVLQQIEADFYKQAVSGLEGRIDRRDMASLKDVYEQEVRHVQLLHNLLGKEAVATITTDFSVVSFSDYQNVIKHASAIENLVISGMNGTAGLFVNDEHSISLAKIVMADARHSSFFGFMSDSNPLETGLFSDSEPGRPVAPGDALASAEVYTCTRFDKNVFTNFSTSKS